MARILLIDDDDNVRLMLRACLTRSGHTVIEARDGREGLELFPETGADLVITDMTMPRKNGAAVLLALREQQPPVKVIAISGGGSPGTAHPLDTARQLGAVRVLAKPFSHSAFMTAITEVLSAGTAGALRS